MPEIKGENTREVWDWKLSKGSPCIYTGSGKTGELASDTWIIDIVAHDGSGVLERINTDIPCEKGDLYNKDKIKSAFHILKSVRDKYARPNIEELKPKVAAERAINDDLVQRASGLTQAQYNEMRTQYKADLEALARAQ